MANVSSTSSCNFLDCQLKKSRPVCLIAEKFGSSSKMKSSPGICQTLRRMLGYHSKTSSKTFLEILMEERYYDRWDVHMMADYFWSIKRDSTQDEQSGKSYERKFLP